MAPLASDTVTRVELRIEPDLCGTVSVGTVSVIKLLSAKLELSLSQALDYVNRCVFSGEVVSIPAPSHGAAEEFVRASRELSSGAVISARITTGH